MDLQQIETYLRDAVRAELMLQKHRDKGKLIDTFKVRTRVEGNVMYIEGFMEDYGEYVDTGRPVGVTKVPVFVLMEWVKRKGIASGDKAKGVAFAIRENIYKQGIPTRGGRRIAPRRTDFINEAIKASNQLPEMLKQYDKEIVEGIITNMVQEIQKTLI